MVFFLEFEEIDDRKNDMRLQCVRVVRRQMRVSE